MNKKDFIKGIMTHSGRINCNKCGKLLKISDDVYKDATKLQYDLCKKCFKSATKKKPKKKKIKLTTLKRKLDRLFSTYIRLRDAFLENGQLYCYCASCGKKDLMKEMDAGHLINRKHISTRYNESNVSAQCRLCNRYDEGNVVGYSLKFITLKGIMRLHALYNLSRRSHKYSVEDYLSMIETYKRKGKFIQDRFDSQVSKSQENQGVEDESKA